MSNNEYCNYKDCNKKLKLIDFNFICKCNNNYCKIHRLPENHDCTYDYKEINKKEKIIESMLCKSVKIDKI